MRSHQARLSSDSLRAFFVVSAAVAFLLPGLLAAASPPGQFSESGNIVTDTKTQLQWQQGTSSDDLDWQGAAAYCEALALDGGGWRLPSMKEIQTLVVETQINPAVDTTFFPDAAGLRFWTSSEPPERDDFAWLFDSNIGHVYMQEKNQDVGIRARCVR